MKSKWIYPWILVSLAACSGGDHATVNEPSGDRSQPAISGYAATLPLDRIKLPEGFSIRVFAEVPNARSLAMSPSGTLFIGNQTGDKVYAVRDTDGDGVGDKRWVIASGLTMPNGVAVRDGNLYVAEVSRILRFDSIESHLDNPPSPVIIADDYPTETHHGWKNIAFGPDGKLYVPVGAPCNICEPGKPIYASITRMNPDGSGREIFASGVRNSVGITWNKQTGDLWFTDNGRDNLGDDLPPDELNRASVQGLNFGCPLLPRGDHQRPGFRRQACLQ